MEGVLGENEVYGNRGRSDHDSFEPDHLALDNFLAPPFCPAGNSRCLVLCDRISFVCMGVVGARSNSSLYLER